MSSYKISNLTPNATYGVRLHFAETWFNRTGQRVFNVSINGSRVLSNFDIIAASGGQNVAVVKAFTAAADGSGAITIGFSAAVNNPMISGIEIDGSSASATPAPSSGGYPIYSSYFTGNTPFHHTVSQLMGAGAHVVSSTIARNFWAEGLQSAVPGSQSGGMGPLYFVKSGDPAYTFRCPAYGTCNANGMTARFPSGAYAQTGSDHHLSTFDPVYLHGEIDGWGGDGNGGQACNLDSGDPGKASCSWGGFYPFSGNGLATDYSSGDAGGYAFGLFDITAQEVLNGQIDHALGIAMSCLDDGGVYPAIAGRNSDAHCPGSEEPNVKYGYLIHVKSSVDVGDLGYSRYCKVIVQALQTYGAYTTDSNGGSGIALNIEQMNMYSSGSNPWTNTIFPSMASGGDGTSWDGNFAFKSCLNRLSSSDLEVIQISSKLP